jgi:aminomethyltransferase
MSTTTTALKRTPFHSFHVEAGAKMVDFAGWEMPLHYGSILDEHRQVRASGGLFDVSHMGRLEIRGRDACRFLDHVCTRQIHGMEDGQARYSLVCNDRGGCRDDVLVYRIADASYLVVCNAANRAKIVAHFESARGAFVFKLDDVTERSAMLAVQGPKVIDLIARYSSEIPALKRYRFVRKSILGLELLISRTGYTGEDGVEVIFRTDGMLAKLAIGQLVERLTETDGIIRPAGLGARDSLRLEAAMALYGHEITEEIDPVSARLDFAIKLDKGMTGKPDDAQVGTFIGQEALRAIAAAGPKRVLVGLALEGRRSARQGMKVLRGEREIGFVTSGTLSPTLDRSIAMAFVDRAESAVGSAVTVDLGRQRAAATVVALPFYKAA